MNITLKSIPHDQQRYETCGDWQIAENGDITILVSDLGDEQMNELVALHELIEVLWCRDRGVKQEDVDAFDVAFEASRKEGDESEPGDAPDAPYRDGHFFATNIERQFAHERGVDWAEYEDKINAI